MAEQERVLLPQDVCPSKYQLALTPDLAQFTFSGDEEVKVEVKEPTSRIVLHAADLKFQSVEFQQNGTTITPVQILLDEKQETATFEFDRSLPSGSATLKIRFTGELNDQMRGFYRSEYTVEGEKRAMAVTQFEATDARRAFPCWDEPAVKATFEVTLVVPANRMAISNMLPVEETTNAAGQKVVRFAETPVMSTYLLAFIVGEFDWVEDRTREGVLVRVFTPLDKKEQGRFALDVANRTLSFFQEYFNIPYPLPKMDLLAIPDFAAGAMENWGAVTYRETAILVDPENSSAATKQRVAVVIAHELAHQWFGNLVTMEWWTHLWLNEGFASWIEYLAVDYLFPEWDIWTQFVFSDFSRALHLDGLRHSHPIEVEVKHPSEINEIFDAVSYSKGASIIRMLAAFLGEDIFRQGLRLYLTRHQYNNATTEDLWSALAEASGQPVKTIMDSWTKQTGYPVLSLEERRQDANLSLDVQQSRFLSSGVESAEEEDKSQWWVPVGIMSSHSSEPTFVTLQDRRSTFTLPLSNNEWIKVNGAQTGFYRVNYPPALWSKLNPTIESLTLPPADRLGVQNDAFALTRAGLLSSTQVLELAEAYKNETDYTVWADLSTNLNELSLLLSQEPSHKLFRAFARNLYSPVARRLGWEVKSGEEHLTALLRSLTISEFGHYGDPATIDEARRRFARFVEDGHSLHPDLRFPIYSLVVENGIPDAYEAILKVFRQADLHEEKVRCLRALGYSQQPDLLQRTLEFSLSNEVRSQDTVFVIGSVALNPHGRELAWQFLQNQWAEFDRRYGKGGFLLARLVSSATENFTTADKAQEVEAFFLSHAAPAAERAIQQSLEQIRSNARWLERDREQVRQWLENRTS